MACKEGFPAILVERPAFALYWWMENTHKHVLKLTFIKHRQDGVNISQEGKQEGSQGSHLEGPQVKANQK